MHKACDAAPQHVVTFEKPELRVEPILQSRRFADAFAARALISLETIVTTGSMDHFYLPICDIPV